MPNKIDRVPYPKADKKLPIVLSVSEVQSMFTVCENMKHKAILSLLCCCGLRVSELINLKWEHLDRSRGVINILQAKGKKDRQVPFPVQLQKVLEYKTKPYVFSGQFGEQYSARSVGEVMKQLATRAGIDKRVYTHLMRHNSFTHMAESGIDINIVQRIAGHSNVKTTNLYLHLSHNRISSLQTPLSQIRL
jgi:site-specific recombinase XerD